MTRSGFTPGRTDGAADQVAASVSEQFGRFAASLTIKQLPESIRARGRLAVLDTVGVMPGALRLAEARPILDRVEEGAGRPEATARGVGVRVPAFAAAFSNAWLADLLDFEDTFKVGGVHSGATVVPTAFAVAERVGASGQTFLAAVIAGYEVANHLASAVFPVQGHYALTTGTAGVIGAAAASGRLLELSASQLTEALNISGFLLPSSAAATCGRARAASLRMPRRLRRWESVRPSRRPRLDGGST